jgi:hypothetical protein
MNGCYGAIEISTNLSAHKGEGAVIELVLKLAALVVDTVVLDDRGDEA